MLSLSGANSLTASNFKNTITPSNICKAWATIVGRGDGTIWFPDAFNVSSGSIPTSTNLRIDFNTPFANTNYCPMFYVSGALGSSFVIGARVVAKTSASITYETRTTGDGAFTPSFLGYGTTAFSASLHVYGNQ